MTEAQFNEFFDCYQDTVNKCMAYPFSNDSEELKFKLSGWWKRNYLSLKVRPRKKKDDMRFIYKFSSDEKIFYKLATGKRNSKGIEGDSIYKVAMERDKTVWNVEESD